MMSRRSFACLGVSALAVATLFLAVEPASGQARARGRGFSAGYSPWSGFGIGYGNQYYGGAYGPRDYSYGMGNYPGYSGQGNYPGYAGWGNYPSYSGGWSPGAGYSWGGPSYYGGRMAGDYYGSSSGAGYGPGDESYGSLGGSGMDSNVLIEVRVPPNAEVWFEGQKTSQTGALRRFVSPPLDSDRNFVYHIRARWTENGRDVDKTRTIHVHAGDRLMVNFINPRSQGTRGTSSGSYGAPGGPDDTDRGTPGGDRSLENRDRSLDNRDRSLDNRDRRPLESPDRTLDNRNRTPGSTTTPGNLNEETGRPQPRNPDTSRPPTGTDNRPRTPPPGDRP